MSFDASAQPAPGDLASLRESFPVLQAGSYLNAGTDGPLPRQALSAATEMLERAAWLGRSKEHFEARAQLSEQLRGAYAQSLSCDSSEVALTTCTTEGLSIVIEGLGLRPGDEILTSDEEHPGLLAPLAAAREIHGVSVRVAPFLSIAEAVGERTKLLACSHVSWMTGRICPREVAEVEVPVLLDGAQGVGAIPVDVEELGCAAYSGAGQKWLCGPDGVGMLYVSPTLRERISVLRRGYSNLLDPGMGLDASLHRGGRRFDTLALSAETLACALAAWQVLDQAGWARVHERSRVLACQLACMLAEHGRRVVERGPSTLVSFESPDPERERARLAEAAVILREIPGKPWLRASVGAWNDEEDIQRLLAALQA